MINVTRGNYFLLYGIVCAFAIDACYNYNGTENIAVHSVEMKKSPSEQKPIEDWYVCGAFSPRNDSIYGKSVVKDIYACAEMSNPDTLNPYWYNGLYHPLYNLPDLREVYNIRPEKSPLQDKVTYLACDIHSEVDRNLYLGVESSMDCPQWLNGKSLQRKDIQGLNFYPIHLGKGYNRYVVKAIAETNDYSFEATVLDSNQVASLYTNGQSNNIVFPEISASNKTVTLTNGHQNLMKVPVKLQFHDVKKGKVYETTLQKDSFSYKIPVLQEGKSYMCSMTIAGQSVRQPVVCGDFDDVYEKFVRLRDELPNHHPRANEIDQILYRLNFLLHHETRNSDWWWQFKIAPLTYQLEIIFANLDGEHGKDKGEFNIQFITYTSKLDGGIQRYLLATPNEMKKGKKYPLVVIVRPHVDHHYHFFTSPQFTHQWAINIIQSLANSHGFIVMLPEARMYHNEDLTPFAEAEMKLAIEDVKKHYKIDEERMYLHGICSGGYRALRMATENPEMFAALGLYTPIYHEKLLSSRAKAHSIENLLPNLAGTPVMIHADPFDRHTPYKVYADLITDCKKYGIPLTHSVKRNTELLYNAVVAGSEAFDFFDGKVRNGVMKSAVMPDTSIVVADLYSQPFVYVYNNHNHGAYYKNMVHTIQGDYKEYMNTDLPLITEDEVDEKMLKSKNVFLIGHVFENPLLVELVDSVKREESDLIDEKRSSISIHRNTLTQKLFVISSFTSQDASYFKYPWIDGMERVLKSDSQ